MNIYNFTEDKDYTKPYKYKILVYPNITWSQDLLKDSYIVVINNIISNLANIRNDLHWTLLLPKKLEIFMRDNVDQIIYNLPTYPNQMRCHFETDKFLRAINWKSTDFDLVYSHLPEHTLQIKNVLYNTTNMKMPFVGYTHWTEFPEITEYDMTVMNYNILGLLEMEQCGINTQAQKNLLIKNAKKTFRDDVIEKLDKILTPQYLGWEIPKYERLQSSEKIIVFNHRPHEYKSYPWFLRQMDRLYKKHTDFKVWVPLAETKDRDYIFTGNNKTRHEYFSNLSKCTVGVCGKQKYAGWSVSATDGMSVGVPYLFYDDLYFRELADNAGCYFSNDEEFENGIISLLYNNHIRDKYSKSSVERYENGVWNKAIRPYNEMFDSVLKNLGVVGESGSYTQIFDFIKKNKSVTKKDILEYMNWGVRISFSTYRNRLRNEQNIVLTKNRYEYSQ